MKHLYLILVYSIIFTSCQEDSIVEDNEQWKQEIIQAEKDFSSLSVKEGVTKAFLTYASKDAVLKRGNILIKGLAAIEERLDNQSSSNSTLEWEPDFVDVSSSGDLGYTYGSYTFTTTDSLGNKQESTGIFHTVWKRQADGEWKFVWD